MLFELFAVMTLAALPANAQAQQQVAEKPSPFGPRTLTVPAGTAVRVRLAETLDAKHSRAGSTFQATLNEPIEVGGRVAVPKGTPFTGAVLESKPSGIFRGEARLELTLLSFRMNGAVYKVRTTADAKVSRRHRRRFFGFLAGGTAAGAGVGAAAGGGAGALIGAGVGAVAGTTTALFTGKKDVRLPVETRVYFSLRSDVTVGG